jgi:hypothetical protein
MATRTLGPVPVGTELDPKSLGVKSWLCSCGKRFTASEVKVDGRTNKVICSHSPSMDNRTSAAVKEMERIAREAVMTDECVQTIDLDEKGVPTLIAIAAKYIKMEATGDKAEVH